MKSFSNTLIFITLAAVLLFALNIFIMSVFFNVDIIHPVRETIPEYDNVLYKNQYKDTKRMAETTVEDNDTTYDKSDNDQVMDVENGAVPVDQNKSETNPQNDKTVEDPKNVDSAEYYMTTTDINSLSKLSLVDKIEALALISKISTDEADKIYDMTLDGVTYAEMKEIQSILGKYLTTDEIQELTNMLDKY
jgi:hypothetical protein